MTEPARALAAVPAPPADPRLGQVVDGRYVIERVLGEGGMGLVYAGRHRVLGRRLALKVLKPTVSSDGDVIERFRREAQAASAIGSPHICDVSDFGALPDGSTYFVMEYLDGPSLAGALKEGPLAEARVVHIARQLTAALGAAHARGIVHRDLKPDNVHLVLRGVDPDFVKVLDFGIAKVGGSDSKLTQAGQVFGTPHYMSPEQCAGRDVDARTDIYALGVLLYEMVCGHVPFDADNLMGVLTKHIYERPLPPRGAPSSDISPGLEAVILRALAKSPDDRYPSMAAMEQDLAALSDGAAPGALLDAMDVAAASPRPAAPRPRPSSPRATSPVASSSRPLRWVFALAATLLFAVSLSTAALLWPAPPEAHPAEPAPPAVDDRAPPPHAPDEGLPAAAPPATSTPPAPTFVELRSDPPRAEVLAPDGTLIGNTPLPLPRPEGDAVRYRIEAPGHRPRTFDLGPATGETVTLSLAPAPARGQLRGPVDRRAPRAVDSETELPAQASDPAPDAIERIGDGLIDPFTEPRRARGAPLPDTDARR